MEQILTPDSLEIHPRDAKRLGVDKGDWVEIRSQDGIRIRARAIPTDRVLGRQVFYASDHFPLSLSPGRVHHSCSVKIKKVADV
jgi:anaerobic selenocysteine-containing dehydrogenase